MAERSAGGWVSARLRDRRRQHAAERARPAETCLGRQRIEGRDHARMGFGERRASARPDRCRICRRVLCTRRMSLRSHAAIDRLAHVVDGEGGDGRRRSAPPSRRRSGPSSLQVAVDVDGVALGVDGELDVDRASAPADGRAGSGRASAWRAMMPASCATAEHVALGAAFLSRMSFERRGLHGDAGCAPRPRARSPSLPPTSTMRGVAGVVEMREPAGAHAASRASSCADARPRRRACA